MATTGNLGTAELRTEAGSDFSLCFERGADFGGVSGFVLGENRYLPDNTGLYWNPATHRGMALTVGGARKGKGASAVIPALLSYGGSCIATDVKGELAWITADRRRELGQRVAILDPFNEVYRSFGKHTEVPEIVTRYNPLSALDPSSISFADDISGVVEALIWHQGNADPFFVGAARELVTGIIAAEVTANPGMASLPNVRDWINLDEDTLAVRCAQLCEMEEFKNTLASRKLQGFGKVTKTNSAVIATCKEQLAFLDSEEMRQFLVTDPAEPFDFSALSEKPTTAYIVLPGSHLETHSRFLRLCVAQSVRHVIRNRPKLSNPIVFFLDEMGTALGPMPILERSWGLTSGYGMVLWGFVQDLNQLKRDYPQSWETFIASSAMIQVIGVRDIFTSNYFSDYLGKATIEVLQASISESSSFSENASRSGGAGYSGGWSHSKSGNAGYTNMHNSWSNGTNGSTSVNQGWSTGTANSKSSSRSINRNEIGKPLLDPDQLRRLPSDQTLVIIPGELPYQLTRLEYFSDPRFFGHYRPDPHYPPPLPEGSRPPKLRDPVVVAAEAARLRQLEASAEAHRIAYQRLLAAQESEVRLKRLAKARAAAIQLEKWQSRGRLFFACLWLISSWLTITKLFTGTYPYVPMPFLVAAYVLTGIALVASMRKATQKIFVGLVVSIVGYLLLHRPLLYMFSHGSGVKNGIFARSQKLSAEQYFLSHPKPPADALASINKRASTQSRLSHQAGWNYTSHLYDLGILSSERNKMTVIGFEDCDGGKTGDVKRWRNVAFLLAKNSAGSWQVKSMAASSGYPTKQDLLAADTNYPNSTSVKTDLLPNKFH